MRNAKLLTAGPGSVRSIYEHSEDNSRPDLIAIQPCINQDNSPMINLRFEELEEIYKKARKVRKELRCKDQNKY